MATTLTLRAGTTAENEVYVGKQGELTYDIGLEILRVHNGSTPPGGRLVGGAIFYQF